MKFSHSKKMFVPASSCLTSASTKVVLSERNVQIKDLESKVKFLKIKIKELENENKTLQNLLSRQERELKKFKEGITDIPALLRSHKEEIKVFESIISTIRKELRDCQKELKLRNESCVKRENQINKLNASLKQNEKMIHEFSSEMNVLKVAKKDLEEKNKVLIVANENLKNENDDLCKKMKDVIHKTQNLEEDLSRENDLNQSLRNELNELKGKFEKSLQEVSNDENVQDYEDQIHCEIEDVSSKTLTENSSVDCVDNVAEKFENSADDGAIGQNICSVKSVDKTKDALINTFISYQHFCNSQLQKKSGVRFFETGSSNNKLLPLLKMPFKESSTTRISDFGRKECVSSSADINFTDKIKYSQHGVSTKDLQRKFITIDCEKNKIENKTNLSCDSTIKGESSFFDVLLNNDTKDWQNYNFKKDIQCMERTDSNKTQRSDDSSFISKDIIETEKCRDLSKALKIRDYLFCKNLDKKTQSILEIDNELDKSLEKEKCIYISESSTNRSKCCENTANRKDFKCKTNGDKLDNPRHRRTFLKQTINTKTLTCNPFDELPEL